MQGVKTCKKKSFDAGAYIFIAPPSVADLEKRLRGRGTETEDKIQKRLSNAVGEMEGAKGMEWDGWIVNDDLDKAYAQLRELAGPVRKQRALAMAAKGVK
jgi:guanylate kinase